VHQLVVVVLRVRREVEVRLWFVVSVQISDACRPEVPGTNQNGDKDEEAAVGTVSSFTRLNYRWIDLRTPANQV
jgi:hypothetical protein